jgi:hypothetical protein
VIQNGDSERANLFSDIFVELALSHINQIVDQGSAII